MILVISLVKWEGFWLFLRWASRPIMENGYGYGYGGGGGFGDNDCGCRH